MKYVFVAIAFTYCLPFANGQIEFGLKGGWNAAWMDFEKKEIDIGFHAGAFVEFPLSSNLFLQPELLYSTRGVIATKYFYPFDLSFDMDYLSIPVMVTYSLNDRVSLHAGPEFNVLLAAKMASLDESKSTEPFQKLEIGLAGGFSLRLIKRLSLQGRYSYGITPAFEIFFVDANGQDLGSSGKRKNRCVQVSLAYKFVKREA